MSARDLGLLALRVGVGGTLVAHGAQKLFGWFGGGGPEPTGAMFEQVGFSPGRPHAVAAGVSEAGYVLLRLPLEVRDVFVEFLEREYPDRAKHVMSVIRSMRGGKDYDSAWGTRMRGDGPYAWQIGRRFEIAARRLGLNGERRRLRTDLFKPPRPATGQLSLF